MIAVLLLALSAPPPLIGIVDRVIDGDTIRLENRGTVRLLGIDTPESVHPRKPVQRCAAEATAFVKMMLKPGEKVALFFSPGNTRDRYGRMLAYVYTHEGRHVNEDLMLVGLARATRPWPHTLRERFIALEKGAEALRLGIWGETCSIPEEDE